MKINILFSKNNKIGSHAIRMGSYLFDVSGLKYSDIPSHTALLIDNFWVLESTMRSGVRAIPYESWKKINIEMANIPIEKHKENPLSLFAEMWGKEYDFIGLLWFIKCILCDRLCNRKRPVLNTFEQENKYFCVELVGRCLGFTNYSTVTPAELLVNIMRS